MARTQTTTPVTKLNGASAKGFKPGVNPPETEKTFSAWQQIREEAQSWAMQYEQCSAKRKLVAWALGLTAAIGTAFFAGELLAYAVLGALLVSNSAFLATLVYIVGLIVAIYAAVQAFRGTFNYVISSKCTEHMGLANVAMQRLGGFITKPFHRKVPAHA